MNDFESDGFQIADDFFDADDLEYFHDDLRNLERAMIGRARGEIYDAACQLPTFLRLISSRSMRWHVNWCLDRGPNAPLYAHANRVLMQPPHDDRRCYDWHQEVFYTIPESRAVQTWAPLVRDSTIEDGTIEVLVGSHKEGIAPATWTEQAGHATQIVVRPEVVAKYEARQIPMRLGQCLFFNSRLIHRSGKNTSPNTRYSLVGLYHDVDAPNFRAPAIEYRYRGMSPREYFDKVNK